MGSGASTAKEKSRPQGASAGGLLDGVDKGSAERVVAVPIEDAMAQDRLQKFAFEGEKPAWKDSYREYHPEHGVNKVVRVEWTEEPAPPKQRSFNSTGSFNNFKAATSQPPQSKPPTPTMHANPKVGKNAPPPNAGRSPMGQHKNVVLQNGQAVPLAPSALGTPAPAIEGPPSAYGGGASQRTQQSGASTVYSNASPMAGRHLDVTLTQTQTQRRSGAGQPDPGGGRSPLIGNSHSKHLETRPFPRRLSGSTDVDGEMNSAQSGQSPTRTNTSNPYNTATSTGSKPPPPTGAPPRRVSRGDSDLEGDSMMADFSQATIMAENMAVSATAHRTMPSLNLAPVAAQAAIRNQPPKPGAMGLHTKGVPGLKLHSNYAVSSGGNRAMPNNVAPPSGPMPVSSHRSNSRAAPPTPVTPASVHSSGGGELVTKTFPHLVKETSDVKRNRAQLPTQLTHAKPTTGDWLKKRYIVNNYILLDTLGTGSYGEVKLSKDRNTDKLFAVKIFSKDFLKKKKQGKTTETYEEDIRREIAIMKKLLHPNVLRLFEVLDDPKVNKMYLVLEYMKRGDLLHFLATRDKESDDTKKKAKGDSFPPVTERELWIIFRQVVQGVKYLHQHNIIHGDIKPHNLLMGDDGIIRIADFGISKMLEDAREKLEDATGTPAFMSPELCGDEGSISGQLADVWAIGATMFMLLFGFPPFLAGSIINLYQKIINDPLVFPHPIDPSLSDLLEHMLEKKPENRYSLDEVIRHPWLKQPPTNYVPSQDKTSTSNFGVWPPAPSYSKQADDAMNSPIKTADKDDLFMSILQNTKTEEAGEDKFDSDNDVMGTNWGADVFDCVDDADFHSGSEDEVESYDSDSVDSAPKPPKKPAIPSKLASALPETKFGNSGKTVASVDFRADGKASSSTRSGAKEGVKESKSGLLQQRTFSFNSRQKMDEEEEKNRTMRFQKANAKKVAGAKTVDSDSDYSDDASPPMQKKREGSSMFDTILDSKSNEDAAPSRNSAPMAFKQPGMKPAQALHIKLKPDADDELSGDELDELSMEDFNHLMDTLSNPATKKRPSVETPTSQSPMVLSSVRVTEMSRNQNNGIGSAAHTEKGQRPNQEDRFVMWPTVPSWTDLTTGISVPLLSKGWSADEVETMTRISMFGIFDGHSGDMCSEYLRINMIPFILSNREIFGKKIGKLLLESFEKIDDIVCDLLRQEVNSSGATSIVALYDGRNNTFTVASTGDSMLILSRAGRAVRMHKMHRLDDIEECARIKKAGGTIVNRRVNGLLAISRALGDTQFKSVDGPSLVVATPDVQTEVITPMTEFAIIATDGLWDVMEAQDAVNFVRKRLGKKVDLQQISREIVQAALERGSVDNVTAIIVAFHVNNPPTPDKHT